MAHPLHRVALRAHRLVARPFHRRPRLIMLFSTMRSGTTLLSQVLTDSPEIAGFGESHVRYDDAGAVLDLKYWTFRFTRRYPFRPAYLFDKVLHEDHVPDFDLLATMAEVWPIFLIRNPADNGRSLQRMFGASAGPGACWPYLAGRYGQLEDALRRLQGSRGIVALSYERLTGDPEGTLGAMTRHLGLRRPLRAQYQVAAHVGRWGLGDGSGNIRSGTILSRAEREASEPGPAPPPEVTTAYLHLVDRLRDAALGPGGCDLV